MLEINLRIGRPAVGEEAVQGFPIPAAAWRSSLYRAEPQMKCIKPPPHEPLDARLPSRFAESEETPFNTHRQLFQNMDSPQRHEDTKKPKRVLGALVSWW